MRVNNVSGEILRTIGLNYSYLQVISFIQVCIITIIYMYIHIDMWAEFSLFKSLQTSGIINKFITIH